MPPQGFIDLPEFPFALEPRILTRWEMHRYAREAWELGVRWAERIWESIANCNTHSVCFIRTPYEDRYHYYIGGSFVLTVEVKKTGKCQNGKCQNRICPNSVSCQTGKFQKTL